MTDRFLKLPKVIDLTTRSRSAIYSDMDEGIFPKSISVGKNAVAWLESEVEAWMQQRIAASRTAAL